MVAWVDGWDSTSTATSSWGGTSGHTTNYIIHYEPFEPGEDPALKRQLQLEISRAWVVAFWNQFPSPRSDRDLAKLPRGWKSNPKTFLLSPERVVSQRYGWQ